MVDTIVVLVRGRAKFTEVERLRPGVTRQQRIISRETFRKLGLQRFIVAALAIAFVENILRQTEGCKKRLPRRACPWPRNWRVEIPTAIEMTANIPNIAEAEGSVVEDSSLNG